MYQFFLLIISLFVLYLFLILLINKMIKRTLILSNHPSFLQQRISFKNNPHSIFYGKHFSSLHVHRKRKSLKPFLCFSVEPEYRTIFNCLSSSLSMKNKNFSDELLLTNWYNHPFICPLHVSMRFALYQRSCRHISINNISRLYIISVFDGMFLNFIV